MFFKPIQREVVACVTVIEEVFRVHMYVRICTLCFILIFLPSGKQASPTLASYAGAVYFPWSCASAHTKGCTWNLGDSQEEIGECLEC